MPTSTASRGSSERTLPTCGPSLTEQSNKSGATRRSLRRRWYNDELVDEVLKVLDGKLPVHEDVMDVDPGKVNDQSGSKIRTFGHTMMCQITQIK